MTDTNPKTVEEILEIYQTKYVYEAAEAIEALIKSAVPEKLNHTPTRIPGRFLYNEQYLQGHNRAIDQCNSAITNLFRKGKDSEYI